MLESIHRTEQLFHYTPTEHFNSPKFITQKEQPQIFKNQLGSEERVEQTRSRNRAGFHRSYINTDNIRRSVTERASFHTS